MAIAIITGVTGQDGSYLSELLVEKGYRVIGLVRDEEKAGYALHCSLLGKIEIVEWDMHSQQQLKGILSQYRPNEFYNFAAFASGAGMFDDPVGIGEVNGISVTRILDAIRTVDSSIRFCQASSSEMFGEADESPQTELSLFYPRTPYGAAKLYAHIMLRIYRQHYGVFACSAILYNHESPRRGLGFVTRKISNTVAKIKLGLVSELHLGNLEASRDWGFAADYVQAMWLMLNQDEPDDYIIASGKAHTVRELCDIAFSHVGLDYQDYVKEDAAVYRATEYCPLVGDISKASTDLGWTPTVSFRELIVSMVNSDLRLLSGNDDINK